MPGKRILIVEDEALVALATRQTLELAGHHVVGTAMTTRQAMAMAMAQPPDLVLMDIRLKGGDDGVQGASRLMQTFGCPVVFVTGQGDSATLERVRQIGPAGYLRKPFTPNELLSAVDRAVR